MHVRRAAVAATGMFAAAAAMGSSPAFAGEAETEQLIPGSAGIPQVLSLANGSAISVGAVQFCGSSIGAGLLAPVMSQNTVGGDCQNGRAVVDPPAAADPPMPYERAELGGSLVSVANGSAISAGAVQFCGSSIGAGLLAPVWSQNTVFGDCVNGRARAGAAPVDDDALISLLNGSSVSALPVQFCGSSVLLGGAALPLGLANGGAGATDTVWGDCRNG